MFTKQGNEKTDFVKEQSTTIISGKIYLKTYMGKSSKEIKNINFIKALIFNGMSKLVFIYFK